MKNATRTKQIQYNMERIDIPDIHIPPASVDYIKRQSRNKRILFSEIYSFGMVLHNCFCNLADIYLGKRTISSSYSCVSNNRFLQACKVDMVKVSIIGFVCPIDFIFSNNIKNTNTPCSPPNRDRFFSESNDRSILQFSDPRVLRRFYMGDNSSDTFIQYALADISFGIESGCPAEYDAFLRSNVACNINQFNRLWFTYSRICDSPQGSLPRKHTGLYGCLLLHVYSGNNLCNNRIVFSNRPHSPQRIVQFGICNRSFNRRSVNGINFTKIKKEEIRK